MVKLVKTINELRKLVTEIRAEKIKNDDEPCIAFVPTMGALHDGHLTLVDETRRRFPRAFVVVSIFVNPLQFAADGRDLERYPRTLDADLKLLEDKANIVFAPDVEELYPKGCGSEVRVQVGEESAAQFEGKNRPGHFDGVLTVVSKLFNIVHPNVAAFGQKDAEQVFLICRMVKQLNFDVEILIVPTVREADGLAMSSRNRLLSVGDRSTALLLVAALSTATDAYLAGKHVEECLTAGELVLEKNKEVRLDYLVAVDPNTMEQIVGESRGPVMFMIAAWIGEVRLIDNVKIDSISK
ncbi:Pantoate--beta-alanine ligase [Aphelenchoides besseyi]|nr:Pantoate--beta-alanine ligase [Aphelenchoides besseyi]